jgi:hypothetical protein
MITSKTFLTLSAVIAVAGLSLGCSGVGSDEQARRAYLGLDPSIGKSLQLGFDGFNSASSANISPQTASGAASGTLTINGQVDQGESVNKGMRLKVGMIDYSDGAVTIADNETVEITYATPTVVDDQPRLELQLRNILNGDFSGTLAGAFQMSGDLDGDVTLNLSMSGFIEDDGTGKVRRVAGSTTVTGTATAGAGNYNVDLTI